MLKAKKSDVVLIKEQQLSKIEKVKAVLSGMYQYTESIENGRIILTTKQGVKLVEVIDTEDDREKYKQVMYDYICYTKDRYDKTIYFDKIDYDEIFEHDILTDKQNALSMFFAYNAIGELLGVVGYKKPIVVNHDGQTMIFQELTIRFASAKKDSYTIGKGGVEAFFVTYLFALNRGAHILFATHPQIRALIFNVQKILKYHYIGAVVTKELFSPDPFKLDLFVDGEYSDGFNKAITDALSKR